MKRFAFSLLALLALSCLALASSVEAKESWTSVRSRNFTLVGNASEREIRGVAVRLEEYHSLLARLFNRTELPQTVPTTVIVFKNDESFKPFRPLYQGRLTNVAGYFQPGRDLNYIAVSAEHLQDDSFVTIFHELVHLFVDDNLHGLPLALNEGLAEYYAALNVADGGKRVTLGTAHVQHLRVLRSKGLLPLETLLAVDYSSASYNEGTARAVFYAESWLLAHYLLHADERAGLERFRKFLGLLAEGVKLEDGLQQAFQMDVAALDKELKNYLKREPFPTREASFSEGLKFDGEMRAAQVTAALAQAYLGDMLLHLDRAPEAEGYLRRALALDPQLTMAQSSFGMLLVKQQKLGEAVEVLRRAASADAGNYLTQYYYAYALSRQGMRDEGTVLGYPAAMAAEMRAALERTRRLAPRFIEAHRLEAFLYLALDEHLDEAEAMLRDALRMSPERQDIMLILAQLHLRRLEFAAARRDLQPILQRAADQKLREQAQELLADIKYTEEQNTPTALPAPQNEGNAAVASSKSDTSAAGAAEQAHAGGQRLAKRFKGERVRGLLTHIECLKSGVAIFVRVGERTLRLYGEDLRRVFFVTYVPGLERAVTCGARTPPNLIVLTYRPSAVPRPGFDGEAIAIEFIPEDADIEF